MRNDGTWSEMSTGLHDIFGATCTGFVYYDSRWYRVTARSRPASLLAKGMGRVTGCSTCLWALCVACR